MFLLAKDDSGTAAVKIWGINPRQIPAVGDVISLVTDGGPKSSIVNKEYPVGLGKFTINASGCQIVKDGAPSQETVSNESVNRQCEPQSSGAATIEETMEAAAEGTMFFVSKLQEKGFTRSEAIALSVNAGSLYPLFWFGQKGVK